MSAGAKVKLRACVCMLLASNAAMCQQWSTDNCNGSLARAYSLFSVRHEATTQGDFNGDGHRDFATLLSHRNRSGEAAIGVCLSRESRPLLITNPYQSTKIFMKPKGTAYIDFETGKEGVYERDAISVSDGTWYGASYILRVGVFARVVDAD